MPESITMREVNDVTDPTLRKLMNRVVREMELTIEKVAANHAKPAEFPLPADENSTEKILAKRFGVLPANKKEAAGAVANARINAVAATRRVRFGDLAAVNLKSAQPIGAQVRAMALPGGLQLSGQRLTEIFTHVNGTLATGTTGATTGGAATNGSAATNGLGKLELRLHKVKCLDETGSGWLGEAGTDEIDLAGTSIDETGEVKKIAKFRVGRFNDGDQKVFNPPRQFTWFNLAEGTVFPKSYFATLVLAEADQGGLPEFVNKLFEKVKEKVTTAIAAAVAAAGAALGSFAGPLGTIIGLAAGYVMGKIFELIGRIWGDDIFPPVTVQLDLGSRGAQWPGNKSDSPEATATFVGHNGTYKVTYDWRLFA